MKNFVLITNEYKDENLEFSKRVSSYISKKGGTATILTSNASSDEEKEYRISDIPAETECIFVLGGDGTFIRAATNVQELGIPIIGVNLGTLGYLCELEEANVFDAIDRLMEDKYLKEERFMLSGTKVGDSGSRLALNDIVIHRMGFLQMLNINVYVNREFLSTFNADGIIVSTPTGSTGYNMSAGGPIVDPNGKLIVLTPINSHTLNSKSIVLGPDDVIEIEMSSRRRERDEKALVSFDGDPVYEATVGDRIVISKATDTISVCKINKRSFLEILSRKMDVNN